MPDTPDPAPPSFDGVRAKLDRADEHFAEVEARLGALLTSGAYAARGALENDGTEYVLRAHIDNERAFAIRLRAGVVFGDAVQNLRIALDHLLCQLVIASGAEPNRQHQFPIYTRDVRRKDPARWDAQTKGLAPHLLDLIGELQPYSAEDGDPSDKPLAVLADLSNADKHRVVLPVAVSIDEAGAETLRPVPRDLKVVGKAAFTSKKPLVDFDVILRFPIRVTGSDPHVELQGGLALNVAFGDALITSEGINYLRSYVRKICERLEAEARQGTQS